MSDYTLSAAWDRVTRSRATVLKFFSLLDLNLPKEHFVLCVLNL